MGCGVSRLNREDSLQAASGPTYLYINPLHRRIEDFAFRRRGDRASAAPGSALADGSTPSSKQLLYVDPDEVDTSSLSSDHKLDSGGGRKSLSSPRLLKSDATVAIAIAAAAAAAAAAAPLPPTRMSEPPVQVMEAKKCGEDGREEMIKEVREVGGGEAVEEVVKEVVAERERGSGGGGGGDRKELDEEKEEEEEIGNISGREDSILLYPGSPSFREYCVFCYDESGDTDDSPKNVDGKSDAVKVENETGKGDAAKVQNETGKASLPSSDSVEVQKKSRKRRRFRVPRRGPAGGMRSLLHVSSCSPRKSFSKTT